MSYIPSDFDDLNGGFNLLNVIENSTDLSPFEGIYSPKQYDFNQQYSLYGDLNLALDFSDPKPTDLYIDFCYIFKDEYSRMPLSGGFELNHYIQNQANPVFSINLQQETYTITQDSDGNEVWLFENFPLTNRIPILSSMTQSDEFSISFSYAYYSTGQSYPTYELFDLCSYNTNGTTGTLQDHQPIVLKWITAPNATFTVSRTGGFEETMYVTFNGTYDNSFIGTGQNHLAQLTINYINPHTYDNVYVDLVEGVDYTISGNTFYSGTGSSAEAIIVNIADMFPEGLFLYLDMYTNLNYSAVLDELGIKKSVFDWGKENGTQYLNVNGKYKLNGTDIITTSGNDIVLSDNVKIPDDFKFKTLNNGTNINNLTEAGIFGIYNATGTLPTGYSTSDNNIFIQNMLWGDETYGRQIFYDIRTNSTYSREKSQGSWTSWEVMGIKNYSYNEIKTGQIFVDGRPIYRKTFNGVFNHDDVLLSNVDVLVRAYGEGDPGTGLFRQLPYFELWNNTVFMCSVVHDQYHQVKVVSYLAGNPSPCGLIMTIEYTKTTD